MQLTQPIGQFNDSYAPITDGVARVVREYAFWLSRAHNPACVITPSAPHYHDSDPFPVIRFASLPTVVRPPYRIGLPNLDWSFQRQLRAMRFRLVHAHCPFASGQVGLATARRLGVPCVASFHTKYKADFERLMPRALVDYVLRKVVRFYEAADQVWTPSQGSADTLREYGYRGSIEIVPNGSDIHLPLADRAAWAHQADGELNTSKDEAVLLYVGQLVLEKNLRLLVEAVGDLRRAGTPFRLLFIGEGYARRELEELVRRERLADRVTFLGVIHDRERMKRIYARASLFLFPSQYDTGSLAMREAAGCGVPSLLVTPSTVAEVIRDGENGFLATNDATAFAARMREVLAQPDLLARAGAEAQRTVYRGWQQIVAEVAGRYNELLNVRYRRSA